MLRGLKGKALQHLRASGLGYTRDRFNARHALDSSKTEDAWPSFRIGLRVLHVRVLKSWNGDYSLFWVDIWASCLSSARGILNPKPQADPT